MTTLISGGAGGADTVFERLAASKYHQIWVHRPEDIQAELIKNYDDFLISLNNKYLNRTYPTKNEYVNNLLRRDVLVGTEADVIFAISGIDQNNKIMGGTAWACYTFISRYRFGLIPLYLFDQFTNEWLQVKLERGGSVEFMKCYPPKIIIGAKYAGIGTRNLNANGIKAIESLYSTGLF